MLAIASKIVAICEGRIVPIDQVDKKRLIEQEADSYLPFGTDKVQIPLTIKENILIPMAGIDESNGNGHYVLWPSDLQSVTNEIRKYLCQRFALQHVGVLLTDSTVTPLRSGVSGVGLAHSGFLALNDYRTNGDLFGRPMQVTRSNVLAGLAATAVLVMGEGAEQTPLVVFSDLPFVTFQNRNPSPEELEKLHIQLEDDLYAPLLTNKKWITSTCNDGAIELGLS